MKNRDLYFISQNQEKLKDIRGIKFVVNFNKNLKRIEEEIEMLEKSKEPTEDYKKYIDAVSDLREKYADKDSEGNPISQRTQNGKVHYIVKARESEFNAAVEKLSQSKTHKEAVEKQQKIFDDFIQHLNADCTIEFLKISPSDVPEDMTVEQYRIVDFMIE